MNRRNFLSLFSAGIAGIALEQAIPLGRVWSFPKEIVIPKLSLAEIETIYLRSAMRELSRATGRNMDFSFAAIRANGWHFPTAAFPPDSSHTPS